MARPLISCMLQAKFFINILAEPPEVVRILFLCLFITVVSLTLEPFIVLHSNSEISLLNAN